ncbi:MAG TPA: hypothetical protein VGN16_15970, partial [Acidobacteriaceae bacterium]
MKLKRLAAGCIAASFVLSASNALYAQGVFDRLKQKAKDKLSNQVPPPAPANAPAENNAAPPPEATANTPYAPAQDAAGNSPQQSLAVYQNYDFVPGESIIFADDFTNTQDGEFPDMWELKKGQAVVNKYQGFSTLLLTDGNYAQVSPRMKVPAYLGKQWTLEFDTFGHPNAYQPVVLFNGGGHEANLKFSTGEVNYAVSIDDANGVDLNGSYPASSRGDDG